MTLTRTSLPRRQCVASASPDATANVVHQKKNQEDRYRKPPFSMSIQSEEGTTTLWKTLYRDAVTGIIAYHRGAKPKLDNNATAALAEAYRSGADLGEWVRRATRALDSYSEPRHLTIASVWAIGAVQNPHTSGVLPPLVGTPASDQWCQWCGVRGGKHRYDCEPDETVSEPVQLSDAEFIQQARAAVALDSSATPRKAHP